MSLVTLVSTPWLQGNTDLVLLIVRLVAGGTMAYYGWEKLRDPKANAEDIGQNIARPGWLFGTALLITEFFGGLGVLFGVAISLAAAAIAFEMIIGTLVKIFKWKQSFGEWSYDVLIFALCLVLLAFGGGMYVF